AVYEGVAFAHEAGGGERGLHAHLVVARFLACVADRGARVHRALALDRAGAGENCFEKCGLTALEWAHQRNAPGTQVPCPVGTSLSHNRLPCRPGGRTWFPGPVTISSQAARALARAEIAEKKKST